MKSKTSKVRQPGFSGCLAFGFFGIFAAVGAGAFYFLAVKPIAGIVAARNWHETQCAILSSQVAESYSSDGSTYAVEITYEYEYDWKTYRGDRYDFSTGSSSGYASKAKVVEAHPPGAEVTCYVDPADPSRSVINRSPGHYLWWSLFPLPFLAVGVGGLIFFLVAAHGRRIASPRSDDDVTARRWLGNASARLRRSRVSRTDGSADPERRGPLELEAGQTPLAKLIAVIVFATLWNGVVSAFIFGVIVPSFRRGDPEWLVTLFMVPFAVIGLATISGVVYQLLALFNPRPHLTLAEGHLTPGARVTLSWRISGAAGRLRKLTIELEGVESARYRSGKSTHADRHVFHTAQVLSEDSLSRPGVLHGGAQNRGDVTLVIPDSTMPSFDAGHNKIEWRLRVRGDIPVWPDVSQDFPLTVFPA